MKWIGFVCVIGAMAWIGHEVATKLAQRPKLIRMLKNALQIFEAEIVYSHATIQEACQQIATQIPDPLSQFFQHVTDRLDKNPDSLYAIWKEEVNNCWQTTALMNSEKEIILQFGRTLGQHDIVQQQKYIQLAQTHLDRKLADAEEMNHRYGRMTRSLGFLAGLFIALLLL
ncbi:stage III sporulation protein SpoAB [Gracilibacillus halophilus YIM-C55.5]|uniref:Stage III sporulation protein SpoAB n=1 Tax=Gracilibacillus halophilus YIM-C55.5 TaxID=1308866 RepID=N4WWI6_9BACI|nr:stage III sporulation protein SpoIIIAB [Gracilibacillus halophilus]ENH97441.1 stage III sporulation protein SpoAB [Gracilibacillus halophilus YIM-C55.5]